MQAHVTQESVVDFERYLRWADQALQAHKQGKVVNMGAPASRRDCEVNVNETKPKVAKYQPLTFQCIRCDQQFKASGKSLAQVAEELSDHIRREHPDLSNSELQRKMAA